MSSKKIAPSLVDEYLQLLTPQDRFNIYDHAHKLLVTKPRMDSDTVTDAWIEAHVQILLRLGLLKSINLIKLERAE